MRITFYQSDYIFSTQWIR